MKTTKQIEAAEAAKKTLGGPAEAWVKHARRGTRRNAIILCGYEGVRYVADATVGNFDTLAQHVDACPGCVAEIAR